jgi:hypothetical protein
MSYTDNDHQLRVDRETRLNIFKAADYRCQLQYPDCTITATELADVGELKASCKECRRRRDATRSKGNQLAAAVLRRNRQ